MLRVGLVIVVLVFGTPEAGRASPIAVGEVTIAQLCVGPDPACNTVTMTSDLLMPPSLTGTLEIDAATGEIEFDVMTMSPFALMGHDGIWTGLEVRDFRVRGSARFGVPVPVTGTPGTAQVTGTAVGISPVALGAVFAFTETHRLNGRCRHSGDISWCVIDLEPATFFASANLLRGRLTLVVPEPETVLLLAVGLVVVGCARAADPDRVNLASQRCSALRPTG